MSFSCDIIWRCRLLYIISGLRRLYLLSTVYIRLAPPSWLSANPDGNPLSHGALRTTHHVRHPHVALVPLSREPDGLSQSQRARISSACSSTHESGARDAGGESPYTLRFTASDWNRDSEVPETRALGMGLALSISHTLAGFGNASNGEDSRTRMGSLAIPGCPSPVSYLSRLRSIIHCVDGLLTSLFFVYQRYSVTVCSDGAV
ncbi:hypothetical protein VUR80DRAFT_6395 [Thermomyces stellatus]